MDCPNVLGHYMGRRYRIPIFGCATEPIGSGCLAAHRTSVQTTVAGLQCSFSAYALLTALGKGTSKSQHEWLKEVMARLGGAFVEMTFHGRDSFGEKGFLRYYRDETTQSYVVELTESMLRLFEEGYTHIEFAQRQKLRSAP